MAMAAVVVGFFIVVVVGPPPQQPPNKGSAIPSLMRSSPQLLQKLPFLFTYFIMSDTVGLFRQPVPAQEEMPLYSLVASLLLKVMDFAAGLKAWRQ
jgi:hypothetical protein